MIIGCCFICVFAVLTYEVSLQVPEEGFIGGSVVLPCSYSEHDLKPQDTDVHWRHNGSKIVCDIVKGESLVVLQDQRYKNRTETFPDEYKSGIFSIKLNNLTHGDAGEFRCFITSPSYSKQETVQLIIKESTTKSNSTEHENPGENTGADGVKTSFNSLYIVIPVLIIVLVLVFIIFICRRKIQNALFSSVPTDDKEH